MWFFVWWCLWWDVWVGLFLLLVFELGLRLLFLVLFFLFCNRRILFLRRLLLVLRGSVIFILVSFVILSFLFSKLWRRILSLRSKRMVWLSRFRLFCIWLRKVLRFLRWSSLMIKRYFKVWNVIVFWFDEVMVWEIWCCCRWI